MSDRSETLDEERIQAEMLRQLDQAAAAGDDEATTSLQQLARKAYEGLDNADQALSESG